MNENRQTNEGAKQTYHTVFSATHTKTLYFSATKNRKHKLHTQTKTQKSKAPKQKLIFSATHTKQIYKLHAKITHPKSQKQNQKQQ